MDESSFEKLSSDYWEDQGIDESEILDDRMARIPCNSCESGWSKLRRTPPGQKTVEDLLFIGDLIETNYSTGGKVIRISKREYYGNLFAYSITYVEVDAPANKDGSYRENHHRYINELVAQDNRILKLYEANEDEVFVIGKTPGQMDLFRFMNKR